MEFLQYLSREQLAWQGRTDDFLDGETLGVAHCSWIRDSGRCRRMSLEFVEYVVNAWHCWGEGKERIVEEDKWEGSVRAY